MNVNGKRAHEAQILPSDFSQHKDSAGGLKVQEEHQLMNLETWGGGRQLFSEQCRCQVKHFLSGHPQWLHTPVVSPPLTRASMGYEAQL